MVHRSVQARVSLADQGQQMEFCSRSGCSVQTDIAQFQVDEIMLKLHDLQVELQLYAFVQFTVKFGEVSAN